MARRRITLLPRMPVAPFITTMSKVWNPTCSDSPPILPRPCRRHGVHSSTAVSTSTGHSSSPHRCIIPFGPHESGVLAVYAPMPHGSPQIAPVAMGMAGQTPLTAHPMSPCQREGTAVEWSCHVGAVVEPEVCSAVVRRPRSWPCTPSRQATGWHGRDEPCAGESLDHRPVGRPADQG